MFFHDSEQRASKELMPGVTTRTFWGERILLSLVDLQPNAVIPRHSHPHEQVGMMLQGEMTLSILDETRPVRPGDVYVIPAGVPHGVTLGALGAQALEAFSPVREEYKY